MTSNNAHDPVQDDAYQREQIEKTLRALSLDGTLVLRGDPDWDVARQAWHLSVDQQPVAVVRAGSEYDIVAVVDAARQLGLRVAPQSTGHNADPLGSLAGTILLKTSALREVSVDPETEIARVEAGALWLDVYEAAERHGLAGLAGTARDVGVVGYTIGGGLSWFVRSHGLAVNQVVAVELVTADGKLRRVDASHDPELFWAIRGGGGSFGVVTALEFRLFPIDHVYAGVLYWPGEAGREVLQAWRKWTETVPEAVTSIARLFSYPPLPEVPIQLRGREMVMVEVASQLPMDQTDELLAPLRALAPEIDTFAVIKPSELWMLHMDPEQPVPGTGEGALLSELTPAAIDAIVDSAGPELVTVELRHLGGAAARSSSELGAVSAFDAGYALMTGGFAVDEQGAAAVHQAIDLLLEAVTTWLADVGYQNFVGSPIPGDVMFGPDVYHRLQEIKDEYDPDNLIHANHSIEPGFGVQAN
ncbi:MAG TPA: FAD-binding oxidoreductase [Kribbella sp.]|nr:FAD-binding oxidoreductase [Kribbella sp.]